MWVFPRIGVQYPQIMNFNRVFHYKPSILGAHPHFWKHPCVFSSTTKGLSSHACFDAPPDPICTSFTSLVGLATHLCSLFPEVRQEVGKIRWRFKPHNLRLKTDSRPSSHGGWLVDVNEGETFRRSGEFYRCCLQLLAGSV